MPAERNHYVTLSRYTCIYRSPDNKQDKPVLSAKKRAKATAALVGPASNYLNTTANLVMTDLNHP